MCGVIAGLVLHHPIIAAVYHRIFPSNSGQHFERSLRTVRGHRVGRAVQRRTMHFSFPRKEEKHVYHPAARHWVARILRTVHSHLRLTIAVAVAVFIMTLLYWGSFGFAAGHGPVVLVAVFERIDERGEEIRILDRVFENRLEYANAHGTSPP